MRRPAILAPLSRASLRRLILAQIPADLADWLDYVALVALLAFQWQAGVGTLALLAIAMGLPFAVMGPLAGVVVDRLDLKLVLVGSNIGRGLATAGFALAPDPAWLLGLIVLRTSVDTLFTPAKQAALPLLAPPEALPQANALSHGINQLSKIIGPALGGGLLAVLPVQPIFLINAALSLAAALLLLGLHRSELRRTAPPPDATPRGFLRQLGDGFACVARRPALLAGFAMMTFGFFTFFLYDTLIALLMRAVGYPEILFGLSIALSGTGGMVGAALQAQFAGRRSPLALMGAGAVATGAAIALLGHVGRADLAAPPVAFLALMFVIGVVSSALFVPYRTLVQTETPEPMMGRVTALGESASSLAILAAPPLGAAAAAWGGIGAPFLIGGYLLAAGAIVAMLAAPRLFRPARTKPGT